MSLLNAAVLAASGLDLAARYALDIGDWGSIDFDLNAVHVLTNERQQAALFRVVDCAGLVGNTCTAPDPEWRWIQNTRWTRGPLTLNLRWQFIDEVTNDAIALDGVSPSAFAVPTIDSQHYFDLSGTYAWNDNITFRAGIFNLLDEDPPVVGNDYGGTLENSGNTYPATYDPLGRSFSIGVNARF